MYKIIQIKSNYFCAGVIIDENLIIVRAAPIIKWAVGKDLSYFIKYCKRKKWKYQILGGSHKWEIGK